MRTSVSSSRPVSTSGCGIPYVIHGTTGHSYRCTVFREMSAIVAAEKTRAMLDMGLRVILGVGKMPAEQEAGRPRISR